MKNFTGRRIGWPVATIAAMALWLVVAGPFIACDLSGGGFKVQQSATPASGDVPNIPTIPGTPGGGNNPPPTNDGVFAGTWVAAYGDAVVGQAAVNTNAQYAVRLRLTHSGSKVAGEGTMLRALRTGATAFDEVAVTVAGTASGDSLTMTLTPRQSGRLDASHTWHLRRSASRMTGMFDVVDGSGNLRRAGEAIWYKTVNATLSDNWVSAFSDGFGLTAFPPTSRTALMVLAEAGTELTGNGAYVEQIRSQTPQDLEFSIVSGSLANSTLNYTFGGLDLTDAEVDWKGFSSGNVLVTAYGQFDTSASLVRNGHATWFRSPTATPGAVDGNWVTSFSDEETASGREPADYTLHGRLTVGEDGVITGRLRMFNALEPVPDETSLDIVDGSIVGTRVQFNLADAGRTFIWDLRLANGLLVGSYQLVDNQGRFVARGHAQWRSRTNINLNGTWAAAFTDTLGETTGPLPQFVLMNITSVTADGQVLGTGALRFAGETSRRLFSVSGQVNGIDARLSWSGPDLFGETAWRLRQAGNELYGTYTNFNSEGAMEFRGSAFWLPTSRDANP